MIGVIFTGGTIGSSISDGYISTDPEMRYMLLKMYKESCGFCNRRTLYDTERKY